MLKMRFGIAAALGLCLSAQVVTEEKVDLSVVQKIRHEAFGQNSKVMDSAFYMTDVYGPRLTGSPNAKAAGEWAVKKFQEWGLANAKMETWGPFGRGWSCTRFTAMMKEPEFQPIIGFAQPWSPGTNGPVSGEAVLAVINGPEDFDKWKGKLKGKMVLGATPHASEMVNVPYEHRLTNEELAWAATAPDPMSGNPSILPLGFSRGPIIPVPGAPAAAAGGRGGAGGRGAGGRGAGGRNFATDLNKFLRDEGVLVVIKPGAGPDGGTVMGSGAAQPTATDDQLPPPSVLVTNEHYNRMARLAEKGIPVTLEFDIATKFTPPADSFNVIAEIPGTNPDAGVVMLGAHFDSWTGGTGATDNAAGSAVSMEAIRILKKLDLKMPRTVRVALWTGEEQGSRGSAAYVKEHFMDSADMKAKPEWGHPRYLHAGQRYGGADLPRVARAVQRHGRFDANHPGDGQHRPREFRPRRAAGLPVHSGSARIWQPHAPLEHGPVRPFVRQRPGTGRRYRSVVRLQYGRAARTLAA
jgi:carboxypeptidase Q